MAQFSDLLKPDVPTLSVEELMPYCRAYWSRIREELLSGTYQPQPVRRVEIPKGDGRTRPIGVPVLEDKIVQRATVEVLNAIYETDFLGRGRWHRRTPADGHESRGDKTPSLDS